jgi:uncharacterized protein (DUF2141 family)
MEARKTLLWSFLGIIILSSFKAIEIAKPATANLEIKILAKKKLPGNITVTLCNNADTFMEKRFQEGIIKYSDKGELSYTFKNIPKGVYAVRIFQDVDGDGELTSNFFGIPKEPFGFSKNPAIKFGPPSFEQASFEVSTNASMTINLIKF